LRDAAGSAKEVYDVNLRPPFDSPDLVWKLAKGCDLIKLNDDELGTLLGSEVSVDTLETGAREFASRTGCGHICVTAGKNGAGLLWEGDWNYDPPQPIAVKDTVGAGDAFLAALLHGWVEGGLSAADNLRRAARVAEFVAGCDGATPQYEMDQSGYPSV
jgi:fructokinase